MTEFSLYYFEREGIKDTKTQSFTFKFFLVSVRPLRLCA